MANCKFCEAIDYFTSPERERAPGFYQKQEIAIVDMTFSEAGVFCGRSTHYGYKLRYCPTCGAKLKVGK